MSDPNDAIAGAIKQKIAEWGYFSIYIFPYQCRWESRGDELAYLQLSSRLKVIVCQESVLVHVDRRAIIEYPYVDPLFFERLHGAIRRYISDGT